MFKRKGGVKGFLDNVKKTALFFTEWLPLLPSLSSYDHERETSAFIISSWHPPPSDSDHFLTAHLTLRPRLMPWLATPLSLETSNLRHTVTEHRPKCPIWDSFFATGLTLKLIAPRDSFHYCLKATTICSRIMASCTQKWTEIITSKAQIQISVPLYQSHDLYWLTRPACYQLSTF